MKIFKVLLLLPLLWLSIAAEAKDAMIDPDCVKSQQECQRRANQKEAVRQHCLADPEWCKERRYNRRLEMEERRELKRQCKLHPDKCAELTSEFKKRQNQLRKENRDKLKQEQEQWCTDNPVACEQWKTELEKIQAQCQQLKFQLMEKFPDRPRGM